MLYVTYNFETYYLQGTFIIYFYHKALFRPMFEMFYVFGNNIILYIFSLIYFYCIC